MADLQNFVEATTLILTNDGRCLVGTLKGYDSFTTNLILSNTHERIYSPGSGVEMLPMGLYVIRGDNVALVGQVDAEVDSAIEWENVRADPIDPISL